MSDGDWLEPVFSRHPDFENTGESVFRGYISYRSPLALALMKACPGDRVDLRAPSKTEHLEVIDVEYVPIPMDPFREPPGAQSKPKLEGP